MKRSWLVVSVICLAWAGGGDSVHSASPGLPFIEDDYPKALAEARARRLPLFIEAWAPW